MENIENRINCESGGRPDINSVGVHFLEFAVAFLDSGQMPSTSMKMTSK